MKLGRWRGHALRMLLSGVLAVGTAAAETEDSGAGREWAQTVQLLEQQLRVVGDADRDLGAFSTKNKLTPKGKTQVKALAVKLDATRQQLQSSLDAAQLLSKRPRSTLEDAIKFRRANEQLLADATDVAAKERAAEQDASMIDRSAEEAEAKRVEAERARAAQEAQRREAEERRKAELEQKKAADDEKKKSEADARRRADEARVAAAEAAQAKAAAAEQEGRSEINNRVAALEKAAHDQIDRARDGAQQLSTFLARPNLTIDARSAGMKLQKSLETTPSLDARIATLRTMPVAQAKQSLTGFQAEVERQGRDLLSGVDAARNLIGNPRSYLTGSAAAVVPPPVAKAADSHAAPNAPTTSKYRTEDIVPMCEFAFEPGENARGVTLSIDNGQARTLPARVRLASGRHTMVVKKDRVSEERHELLLCGHIAVIPIDVPK